MNQITRCLSVTAVLSCILTLAFAQQRPFYSQYFLNPFVSNPALAGIENYWDVRLSYRNQWRGIPGEPTTLYMSAQGPFKRTRVGRGTIATISSPGKKNPSADAYWVKYKSASPHAGLGFTLISDKAGPLNWYSFNTTYAYHLGLTPKTSLSAGITAGLQGINVDTDQLDFGPINPNDPSIGSPVTNSVLTPDLSLGLWYYSAFYFVGISAQHVIPTSVTYSENNTSPANGLLVPHGTLTAGYKFIINEDLTFLPSVIFRLVNNAPLNFDVSAKFQYHDVAWIATSYRHSNSFAGMFGINVNSNFNIAYSYDWTTSNLNNVAAGAHEIVIGILLGNRNRVLCPRDFW